MSYATRLALTFHEIALVAGKKGPKVAFRVLRRRFYRVSEALLFAKEAPFPPPELPQAIRIEIISPVEAKNRRQEIFNAVAGPDVLNFERGAVCYVAYVEGKPAGVGWRFPESRLLNRLGLGRRGIYLGGFFVHEPFRGGGIYPLLLSTICSDSLSSSQTAFAETSVENKASRRGLVKAGFAVKGRLHMTALAGVIIRCRLKDV